MSRFTSRRRSSLTIASRVAAVATVGAASLALVSTAAAATAPSITTNFAPLRSSTGSYTLYGDVNPNGAVTTTKFQIGISTSYGISQTAATVSPTSDPNQFQSISTNTNSLNLNPGTTYHWRVSATNSAGTTVTPDQTFVATAKPSGYARPNPIRFSDGSYQLNGEVNPGGLSTTTQIWFGTPGDSQFGPTGPTLNPIYQPGQTQSFAVNTNFTYLTPGAPYSYYVKATNSLGTFTSPALTWTPTAKPVVTAGAAPVRHSDGTYTLSGKVNPAGLSTTTQIWLGTSTTPYTYGPYGPTLSPTVTPGVAQPVSVDTDFTGLTPGVTYHYRTEATNSLGTTYGADQTFVAS